MPFWILPITPRQIAWAGVGGLAVGFGFCYLLARYWSFYHLLVGGGFAFVLLLPVAVVGGALFCIGAALVFVARGVRSNRAVPLSVGLAAVIALGTLAGEVQRTRDLRSGEGEGAGRLTPFFRSLVGL
jgi:hypothetical protein